MRDYVLTDPSLVKWAGQFVWLSVDTERDENAAYLARFPVEALPTFLIIDPRTEQALATRASSATVGELTRLLEQGAHARSAGRGGPADAAFAKGQRLLGAGQAQLAAEAFGQALAEGGSGFPRRAQTEELWVLAYATAGNEAKCAEAAMDALPNMAEGARRVDVAATGLDCGLALDAASPLRARAIATLGPAARAALAAPGLLADDRSSLYGVVCELDEAAGDKEGARVLAGRWLAFLEKEAARAPTPEARAVFDAHRLDAALALGAPALALPALLASERDLPRDYNPPARLAVAYLALGRLDDALAASDRALALVYGPRRLRVLSTRVKIYRKKGDVRAARSTLSQALEFVQSLPPSARNQRRAAQLKSELAAP